MALDAGCAISMRMLGKQYRRGVTHATGSFVEAAAAWLKRPFSGPGANVDSETFWALRDFSADVPMGTVLGVIGANGAGKSTLLKLLSRITAPTRGEIWLRGTVASLLEVGTGFHPELTGRENIYLNGAVLGIRRTDVRTRLDEIVDFAGVGEFLDTPVKRYSSGMHLRLAFAVAAHLYADVMLVDEVLAVGDHEFQQKCLGKMGEVVRGGRTVVFVSHDMHAVQTLCNEAIHIHAGQIVARGPARTVVSGYMAGLNVGDTHIAWDIHDAPGDDGVKLLGMRVLPSPQADGSFSSSRPPVVEFDVALRDVENDLCIGFDLMTADGAEVLRTYQSDMHIEAAPRLHKGRNKLRCTLPAKLLNGGVYYICPRISIHRKRWIVQLESQLKFELQIDHGESPYFGTRQVERPGVISPVLNWIRVGDDE